eukprot:7735814-Pyramimonas_sp.AAC.1
MRGWPETEKNTLLAGRLMQGLSQHGSPQGRRFFKGRIPDGHVGVGPVVDETPSDTGVNTVEGGPLSQRPL